MVLVGNMRGGPYSILRVAGIILIFQEAEYSKAHSTVCHY